MNDQDLRVRFSQAIHRIEREGDLPALVDMIKALEDQCKYNRYSEDVYKSPEILQHWNGAESAYYNLLDMIQSCVSE